MEGGDRKWKRWGNETERNGYLDRLKGTGREKYEMERRKREEVCDEKKDVERRKERKGVGERRNCNESKVGEGKKGEDEGGIEKSRIE